MKKVVNLRTAMVTIALAFLCGSNLGAQREGNWDKFQDPYSSARGNCPQCNAGEAMALSTIQMAHGVYVDIDNPPCGDAKFNSPHLGSDATSFLSRAFNAQVPGAAKVALGFADQMLAKLGGELAKDPSSIGRIFRDVTNQPQVANCVRVVVVLPKSISLTRSTPGVLTVDNGTRNPHGWDGVAIPPTVQSVDDKLFAVFAVAKNWSHDRDGSATLRVFYKR